MNSQFSKWIESLPSDTKENFKREVNKVFSYEPKVAIFGKTGVGKSSLTNAIFGRDACPISDVFACTRSPQEVFLKLDGDSKGIKLLDVPGIGENSERDKEYFKLYAEILKEADMVLWVLKGDDRTFTSDEDFYKTCMKQYVDIGKPFVVAINQVDKIEPYREWDITNCKPGPTQDGNIAKKITYVAEQFGDLPISQVIPVSANEQYNLSKLILTLIKKLPPDKKFLTINNMNEKLQKRDEIKKEKEKSFTEVVHKLIDALPIPEATKIIGKTLVSVVGKATEYIASGVNKFISIFGF
ncbi:GTPase family protein [Aeromonas veronii]|uniref:Small GTP-binding protein domain protein n=1 Tax=Aeromonas veronii AMC34 TaxID=1073383 RepID=K1JNP2_AERVE|nr:GTPase [Aeromonas veronii]EKB20954.1 small GTP-binding protein domain protein [Aeromonas veronii AMC34]